MRAYDHALAEALIWDLASIVNTLERDLNNSESVSTLLIEVHKRYGEPWRKYHSLKHIVNGFKILARYEHLLEHPTETKLAWLFHDIVWVPGAKPGANEHCSAELAEELLLHIGVSMEVIKIVKMMIIPTTDHHIPENYAGSKNDLAILLGIDLYGFGEDIDIFIADGEDVRAEMGLSPEAWREGRAKFAKGFLMRGSIYHHPCFKDREGPAKENLAWAVNEALVNETR